MKYIKFLALLLLLQSTSFAYSQICTSGLDSYRYVLSAIQEFDSYKDATTELAKCHGVSMDLLMSHYISPEVVKQVTALEKSHDFICVPRGNKISYFQFLSNLNQNISCFYKFDKLNSDEVQVEISSHFETAPLKNDMVNYKFTFRHIEID